MTRERERERERQKKRERKKREREGERKREKERERDIERERYDEPRLPLSRRATAGVSDADFTALEKSVTASSSKPTEAAVNGQINAKNAAQLL